MKILINNIYSSKASKFGLKVNAILIKSFVVGLILLSGVHFLEAADSSEVVADKMLPMLAGLVGVLAVIFLLAFIFKKVTSLNVVSKNISIVESQNIGAKEKLVVVEIQDEQYLLGVTSHQISPICELREPIIKTKPELSFDKLMEKIKNASQRVK